MRYAPRYCLALLLLLGVLLAGCGGKKPAKETTVETTATAVPVVKVTETTLNERVSVTGTLQPTDHVEIGPKIGGRITWVIGPVGTAVQRGQVVVRLDDEDARTQVRAAEAAVRAAKARLTQARAAAAQQLTNTDAGIRSAEAGVQAAKARLEQAKAAAEQQLVGTDSGIKNAQAALEAAQAHHAQAVTTADATEATTQAQYKAAQATLDAAKSRLAVLKNGSRAQEKIIAEKAVEVAKASLDKAQADYDRAKNLYEQGAISRSQLDNAEMALRVSRAQYDSALQQLSLVQTGARQEDIDAAEAAVRQAQDGLDAARAALKQIDVAKANVNIAKTGVSQAQAALDTAISGRQVNIMRDKDVLSAQAGVYQALQALESAKANRQANLMRNQDVLAADAGVQQAQETLTLALQHLDDCSAYSPVDGVIATKLADIGQSIGGNDTVYVITTDKSLHFEANVSELEATRLRAGQPVRIAVDALQSDRSNLFKSSTGRAITGTVERVVPVVDERTRNFLVRILVPRDAQLFPGMFARGEVMVAEHKHAIAVPKEALVIKGDHQVVFVAEGDKARERTVVLGAVDGKRVQILSGVMAGEQVITAAQTLKDGDPVTIVSNPAKQ